MTDQTREDTGVLIRTNGKVEKVAITGLEDMQSAVGGLIEVLPIDERKHGFSVWINEEGRLLEQPINMTASLWLMRNDAWPGLDSPVHGDVLILGPTDDEGATTSATEDIFQVIPRFWKEPAFTVMPMTADEMDAHFNGG
jgi:hypothetical protein